MKPFTRNVLLSLLILAILLIAGQIEYEGLQIEKQDEGVYFLSQEREINNVTK